MPRVSRQKAKLHEAAVSLPKRSFAVPDEQVTEAVLPANNTSLPASTLPSLGVKPAEASSSKRKLPFVVPEPSLPLHPYSRSHRKRENKKTRQLLAGGNLDPLAAALSESIGEPTIPPVDPKSSKPPSKSSGEKNSIGVQKTTEQGKSTSSKGKTLGEKARRKQIEREGLRARMVAKLPAYQSNPWGAIREHAGNTLVQKG